MFLFLLQCEVLILHKEHFAVDVDNYSHSSAFISNTTMIIEVITSSCSVITYHIKHIHVSPTSLVIQFRITHIDTACLNMYIWYVSLTCQSRNFGGEQYKATC